MLKYNNNPMRQMTKLEETIAQIYKANVLRLGLELMLKPVH